MRAYVVTVIEIEGEKTPEYITSGKFALLNRTKESIADAAYAVARTTAPHGIGQIFWTDDAPVEGLEDWQLQLMSMVEEDNE